ncbi:Guanine nucleotide-binding protein alpha-2 subunit [Exophiala dermatitidis]
MGCTGSRIEPQERESSARNAKIERQLRHDRKTYARTVKILLLGAGESGKSTIIKQMRIIHSRGFQDDERVQIRAVIYSNVVIAFRILYEIMQDEKIDFEDEANEAHAEFLDSIPSDVDAHDAFRDKRVKEAMLTMWKDAGVQKAVAKGHEFALHDNLSYYFQNINRMFEPDWIPDDQDILHARLRTTGITETVFELRDLTFRMMDVGGQRSERKKWIHCFEGVQCLLFMAAMSGYDQCLVEDANANQMHEAMMLFESLVNGQWFKDKPIILFLNKIDLFREKLPISPISAHFPDYTGGDADENAAKEFFANKFRALNRNSNREIYIHFTNATDTNLLKATMEDVQDILIQKNLQRLVL